MGQLHFIVDGRTYVRNFKYIVFQDRDGLMTELIPCSWSIMLVTGRKEESDERVLVLIEDPASIRKRKPKDWYPVKMEPLFVFLFGAASMFALMVVLAFIG